MGFERTAAGSSPTAPASDESTSTQTGYRLRWQPSWALLTGALALAGYLLLLPLIAQSWRATGDEPHYLLAAHSLVVDGDWDLSNNYAAFDYLNFYFSREITPQIRLDGAGRQILNHYPGLSLLIAPAYALGGRFGVLLFQALLGGLLAGLMFSLARLISGDDLAALLATLAVAFSPPLLFYPYLVYPEFIAALLTTLALYLTLRQDRPSPGPTVLLLLALVLLPWLNRRFIPLALLLAGWAVWSWRRPGSWRGLLTPTNGGLLAATALSIAALFWYNSHLTAPARTDITAPASGVDAWFRLVRGVGWLVDQQRGLLIFAPLYILGLWGLPALLRQSWQERSRQWGILLPFALSLAMVTVAGGFWIAWELGPRYLVVGLPALAPLLALAWRDFARSPIWLALAALLTGLSLFHSWLIVADHELPYKSSLPIYYDDTFGTALTDLLPNLGGYQRLTPANESAAADMSQPLLQAAPLTNLSFGHYVLEWPLQIAPNLPPETPLLRLSLKHLGGGPVLNRLVTAADLPADGLLRLEFFNARPDRWRTPLVFNAVATGDAPMTAGDVLFRPDNFHALILPYLAAGVLLMVAVLAWRQSPRNRPVRRFLPQGGWLWLPLAALLLGPMLYVAYAQTRPARSYDAAGLNHFTGRSLVDAAAGDGRAWRVDPAIDPPQKAIYGPYDFYDSGRYRVTFRVKLSSAAQPPPPDQEVARLQVVGAAADAPLQSQSLRAEHFSRPDLYHDLILTIENPRRQALSFELVYLATAALAIDGVTIEQLSGR